ncbi:MAG: hypothetical protein HY533_01825 [Chloroflexi bacterium]|nr:hypothetical protein [Chloroflexota bacterium]
METQRRATTRTRRIGRILILAGVSVWIPYFALEFAGKSPEVAYCLPAHLSGVIPGAILSRWGQLKRLFKR